MKNPVHTKLVEDWYKSLKTVDLALFQSIHAPDCIYNVSGHSPISGRCDFPTLMKDVLPQVFGRLDIAKFKFALKHRIMCQDEHRVVGMMEADGPGTNGKRYDQRYCHTFEFRGDKISQVWEFFDTELARGVLFYDPENSVTNGKLPPFEF